MADPLEHGFIVKKDGQVLVPRLHAITKPSPWGGPAHIVEYEARWEPLDYGPPQPADGYTKNVTPRGPVVRPEDAFPESCCEGGPMEDNQ